MPICQGIALGLAPGTTRGSGPFLRSEMEQTCPHDSALGSPSALSHSHKPTDPVPGMGRGDKRQGAVPAGHPQPEPWVPASLAEGPRRGWGRRMRGEEAARV